MIRLVWRIGALIALLTMAGAPSVRAQDSTLQRALRDELDRSIRDLHLGQLERPYFIAYRAYDSREVGASATGGSLLSSHARRTRNVQPEVRVGSYEFDNTNFMSFGGGMALISIGSGDDEGGFDGWPGQLPLDDNYLEFRRQTWLMTDFAYKHAAESYAAKRAALLNRTRRDSLPDFSRATPTQTVDTSPAITFDRSDAETLVRALSALPELARLYRSTVRVEADNSDQYLLNSEGTTSFVRRPQLLVMASASTQASDGTPIGGSFRAYARSVETLPAREQLASEIRALALRVDSLRSAPILERYAGPVLFEGRAAAELFAERFAPLLVGRRLPEGGPDFAAMMDMGGRTMTPFGERVRSRVLPASITVVDDPTLATSAGVRLFGVYKVDADGVPARRKVLIENGIVKQVLTTRVPVRGFPESSGNRRGEGAAPSNLIVTSTNGLSDADLKSRLIGLVKDRGLEYGIIVRELGSAPVNREDPSEMMREMRGRGAGRSIFRAYRVYPDGREELVRSARLMDLTAESFKDIVATSSTATVLHRGTLSFGNFPFSPSMEMLESLGESASASLPLTSYVVPSLLFEDISLERGAGEQPRPPLSPPPSRN